MIPTRFGNLTNDFVFVGFYRDRTRIYAGYASKTISTIPVEIGQVDQADLDQIDQLANTSEVVLFEKNCLGVKGVLPNAVPLDTQGAVVYFYHKPMFRAAISYLTCDHSKPVTNDTVSFVYYRSRVLRWQVMHLNSTAVRKGFSTLVQEIKHED